MLSVAAMGVVLAATGGPRVGIEVAWAQEPASAPETVIVAGNKAFTDSGIDVARGDSIVVRATGEIEYRGGAPETSVSPAGVPLGRQCASRITPGAQLVLPAPGEPCWSLIGRVGDGRPFGVGASATISAPRSGRLYFGVNEAAPADNGGAWTATVTVKPATTTVPSTAPESSASGSSSSGSSGLPIVVIVFIVAALAALGIVVWVLLRRRRPAPDRELVLEPDAPADAVLVGVGTASGSTDSGGGASHFDPESPDVNIFRVVLSERDEIDLGYNFFPSGTVVAWRVTRRGTPLATGEFTAEGGGSAQHFLTLPLGVALERDREPVEILFSWAINEMPFTYLVRREPARMT